MSPGACAPLPDPLNAAQGADTVIYERLDLAHPVNKELRAVTRAHMEAFGAGGLRTLCLSYCELDHASYDQCASHVQGCAALMCMGGQSVRAAWLQGSGWRAAAMHCPPGWTAHASWKRDRVICC